MIVLQSFTMQRIFKREVLAVLSSPTRTKATKLSTAEPTLAFLFVFLAGSPPAREGLD